MAVNGYSYYMTVFADNSIQILLCSLQHGPKWLIIVFSVTGSKANIFLCFVFQN